MADQKISQLTLATTPLAGTETLPVVQSSTTKQVSVANLTAGRTISVAGVTSSGSMSTNATIPAWGSGFNGVQLSNRSSIFADGTSEHVSTNAYFDGSAWKYIANDVATNYYQYNGEHVFRVASSGGAGASITWINAGKFDVSGNFVQGTAAKGVNFTANTPAAGMTSQLLNWYEEGTWTPNQGAGLTVVGAFSSSGTYTRIGRQITVRGQVAGATSVAVNAAATITSNLPYSAATTHAGSMFDAAVNASGVVQVTSSSVVAATTIAATANITFTATYQV